MCLPISTVTPERILARQKEFSNAFYKLGSDLVAFIKEAGKPRPTYALAGRLVGSKSGWLLLEVPNALVRGTFDHLHEPGVELPPDLNAHISVMRPEELETFGGLDKVTERGHFFRYQLGPIKEVEPHSWGEMSKVWFISVKSPELEKLRKSYGLSAKPKYNEFDFHITVGVRRKKVLQEDSGVSKAASDEKNPYNSLCPVCSSPATHSCRCWIRNRGCKNGHDWYECPVHNIVHIGTGHNLGKGRGNCICPAEKKAMLTPGEKQNLGIADSEARQGQPPASTQTVESDGVPSIAPAPIQHRPPDLLDHTLAKDVHDPQTPESDSIPTDPMNPSTSPSLPVMNKVGLAERLAVAIDYIGWRKQAEEQEFKNYTEARNMAEERRSEFHKKLKAASDEVDGHFVVHIKSKTAFKEKEEAERKLNDVLRGALIVEKEKYPAAVEAVRKAFGKIVEVDDVSKPRGELGYKGAIHLDVEVDGMFCEVQVLTKALWKAKLKVYRIYRKHRNGKNRASKSEIARARKVFEKISGAIQIGFLYKEAVDKPPVQVAIAVDLDGTIVDSKVPHVDGEFGKIRDDALDVMQEWKDKGYHVIIWTARDDMSHVREWLKENKVPHDELNRYKDGPPTTSPKVIATVYVDDRAVNARRDWKYIRSEVAAMIAAGPKKIPLPMIGHYEPGAKIKRDAFLYQDPKGDPDKFAQCESCVAFTGKSCAIFPKGNTVSPGGSCGVYRYGKGDPDMVGKETGQFSKTQAGYVERPVRCENCAYFDDDEKYCELFKKLNKQWPHIFDLDKDVNPKGCCDAQTARGEKVKEARQLIIPSFLKDAVARWREAENMPKILAEVQKRTVPSNLTIPNAHPVMPRHQVIKMTQEALKIPEDFSRAPPLRSALRENLQNLNWQPGQPKSPFAGGQAPTELFRGVHTITPHEGGYSADYAHGSPRLSVASDYAAVVPGGSTPYSLMERYKASPNQQYGRDFSLEAKNSERDLHSFEEIHNASKINPLSHDFHNDYMCETPITRKDNPFLGLSLAKNRGAEIAHVDPASRLHKILNNSYGPVEIPQHLLVPRRVPPRFKKKLSPSSATTPSVLGKEAMELSLPSQPVKQAGLGDYTFIPGAGSGVNFVDRVQDYVRRQQEWDAGRIAAQYDRPTYARLMRGLGRLTGVKPNEQFIEKATGDVAAAAPWANQLMPGMWNMLHGPRGSTANLAKNLYASGDVDPFQAANMAGLLKNSADHDTEAQCSETRHGRVVICPHCGCELTDKDIYTDKKGWTFCRKCLRKGKGSIKIPAMLKRATGIQWKETPAPGSIADEIYKLFRNRTGSAAQALDDFSAIKKQKLSLPSKAGTPPMQTTGGGTVANKVVPGVGRSIAQKLTPQIAPIDTELPGMIQKYFDAETARQQAISSARLASQPTVLSKPTVGGPPNPFEVKMAGFQVAPSKIHGNGVFSDVDLQPGDDIGLALTALPKAKPGEPGFKHSTLGRYLNHSDAPNAELVDVGGGNIHCKATAPIEKGSEITLNYKDGMDLQQKVYDAVKTADWASGMGSGAEGGQNATVPNRLVDGSGATPAGAENQPVVDSIKLDEAEIAPDADMFDLASIKTADLIDDRGTPVGTFHKRLAIPKSLLGEDQLKGYGFEPVVAAIPEQNQDRFTSYRNPKNLYHIHSHGDHWTVHRDRHPSATMAMKTAPSLPQKVMAAGRGMAHVATEGVPGMYAYMRNKVMGTTTTPDGGDSFLQRMTQENPRSVLGGFLPQIPFLHPSLKFLGEPEAPVIKAGSMGLLFNEPTTGDNDVGTDQGIEYTARVRGQIPLPKLFTQARAYQDSGTSEAQGNSKKPTGNAALEFGGGYNATPMSAPMVEPDVVRESKTDADAQSSSAPMQGNVFTLGGTPYTGPG